MSNTNESNDIDNDNSHDDSDDEPLSLDANTLAALQSVMGSLSTSSNDGDLDLAQLLQSRRIMDDDDDDGSSSDDDDDNDDGIREGESHADYYRRLYPERYSNTNDTDNSNAKIEQPVSFELYTI